MDAPAIRALDVRKTYRRLCYGPKITALNGLTLRVPRGDCWGVLGPAGSGKTTLARLLSSQITADSGTIDIFGKEPANAAVQYLPRGAGGLEGPRAPALTREFAHRGGAVLVFSRNPATIESLCDSFSLLEAGRIVASGTLDSRRYRLTAQRFPDVLQEELARLGFVIGYLHGSCWIESEDRERLNLLIDRLRAAGVEIGGMEQVKPSLEQIARQALSRTP